MIAPGSTKLSDNFGEAQVASTAGGRGKGSPDPAPVAGSGPVPGRERMAHIHEPEGTHFHHEGAVTSVDVADREDVHKLKGSAVGLVGVLFLCVTGSAPLAVLLFNMPYVIPLGSEYGGPGAFFFATIVLTIFS